MKKQQSDPIVYDEGAAGELTDEWYKILAFVMHKLGVKEVTITLKDIEEAQATYQPRPAIVADTRGGSNLVLRLMSEPDALKFAAQSKQD